MFGLQALLAAAILPQAALAQHSAGHAHFSGGYGRHYYSAGRPHYAPYHGYGWRGGPWYHGGYGGWYGGWPGWGWGWWLGADWDLYYPGTYTLYPYAPPVSPALLPPPPQYWYWCQQPQGYYPYVVRCLGSWQAVPVTFSAQAAATPPSSPQDSPKPQAGPPPAP